MSLTDSKHPRKSSTNEPPSKKKKVLRCKNCNRKCPTIRSLNAHFSFCTEVEVATNVQLNNYSSTQFNQELARGNINPHSFRTGQQYQSQLQNHNSIREQYLNHQQQNDGGQIDDVDIPVDVDFEF